MYNMRDLHLVVGDTVIESPSQERHRFFEATGLDPELVRLFPDGHRVVQRRISYRPDFVGSPYYDRPWQVLEEDHLQTFDKPSPPV